MHEPSPRASGTRNHRRVVDLVSFGQTAPPTSRRLRVLLLADDRDRNLVVRDHIKALLSMSAHDVVVANPLRCPEVRHLSLRGFDAVLIHYSICIVYDVYLPELLARRIRRFPGAKVEVIQDEYRWVNDTMRRMAFLGIDAVVSSLSLENIPRVYRGASTLGMSFFSSLPGYAPLWSRRYSRRLPMRERSVDVFYRGRQLPYWYGRAAQEKHLIGEQFRAIAKRHGLRADIETSESTRIYGRAWIDRLRGARAVLGTEGGVSIVDFESKAQRSTQQYLEEHPDASFEEVHEAVLRRFEGNIVHRTITPRVFEAAAAGAVSVMYPGEFRGLLQPWVHYVPFALDGSNERKVIEAIRDDTLMDQISRRAYDTLVSDPALAFDSYVRGVDAVIDDAWERRSWGARLRVAAGL